MTTLDSKLGKLLVRNGKLFGDCGCCDITDVPDPCNVSDPPFGLDEQGTHQIRYFPTDMTQEGSSGIQGARSGSGTETFTTDYRVNLELFPTLRVNYRFQVNELYNDISVVNQLIVSFQLTHIRLTTTGLVGTRLTSSTSFLNLTGAIARYESLVSPPELRKWDLVPFTGSFTISPIEEIFPPAGAGRRWKMQRFKPNYTVIQPLPHEITELTNDYDDVEIIDNCDSFFRVVMIMSYVWNWRADSGIPNPGDPIRISADLDYSLRVTY